MRIHYFRLDDEKIRWIGLEPRYYYLEDHFLEYLHVIKDYERMTKTTANLGDGDTRKTNTQSSQTYSLGNDQLCVKAANVLEIQNCSHFSLGQPTQCISICR